MTSGVTDDSVHAAPFWHGLLKHSSTSMSQFAFKLTSQSSATSEMKSYPHTPCAKPAAHMHLYACAGTLTFVVDSMQLAPFWHGPLLHSFTSTSQFPDELPTPHCSAYSSMKLYAHTPLLNPSEQAHEYASLATASPVYVVARESVHPAPF